MELHALLCQTGNCASMHGEHFVAQRVKSIGSSGIRRVFELGAKLADPIDLSIGQPDYAIPDAIKDAIIEAVRNDRTGYTLTRGLPALRDRIAAEVRSEFDYDPDLLVTCGVSGGLQLALLACLNPGDEVLIGDPYFVSYPYLVHLAGGVPVLVDTYDDFGLHPERFAEAVTSRTKAIILCSPGNPTGTTYAREDIEAIAALARDRDLLLISDEIYCVLNYDGAHNSVVPYAKERTILLRGFSKTYAMTGLRLGYAAGPKAVITQMARLQQYTFVCAPHPVQIGALSAFDIDMSAQVDAYRTKRDLVCSMLDGVVDFVRPSGGFYVFPKIPPSFDNATSFVDEAIGRNLLVIPGEVFSRQDTHFRISYAASDDKLRAGCDVIASLAQ